MIHQSLVKPPLVMGILNVTPDRFSDGGRHATIEAALAHAMRLIDQGADVLDQEESQLLQFLHDFASRQPARRRDPAVVLGHMLPHRLGFPAQGA